MFGLNRARKATAPSSRAGHPGVRTRPAAFSNLVTDQGNS